MVTTALIIQVKMHNVTTTAANVDNRYYADKDNLAVKLKAFVFRDICKCDRINTNTFIII